MVGIHHRMGHPRLWSHLVRDRYHSSLAARNSWSHHRKPSIATNWFVAISSGTCYARLEGNSLPCEPRECWLWLSFLSSTRAALACPQAKKIDHHAPPDIPALRVRLAPDEFL